MENGVRKREWVKTAAIILLAVLLVLTFFSKTIMNASLPEVATQQVSSGAINARIRGQGTVEASEVYNVTIKQTRKVASVLVKTGQEINVGDTLFVLEAEDSDELKQAETDLETLQQNYDKSLIEAGNTARLTSLQAMKSCRSGIFRITRACISIFIRRIARKQTGTKRISTMILPSKLNSSGRWRSTSTTF